MNPKAKTIFDMIRDKRKQREPNDMYDGGSYLRPEYLAEFYKDSEDYKEYFEDHEYE